MNRDGVCGAGDKEVVKWNVWTGKNWLLPLCLSFCFPSRNCQSSQKSKNLNNSPPLTPFNNQIHFPLSIGIIISSTMSLKIVRDQSSTYRPKVPKAESTLKTFLCQQHRVWSTCGASLHPATFFHPRPVGSRLPAGTAVRHHLSPLGGHWRVAAAYKPGGRGRRAHRTSSPPQLSRVFQRLTNRNNYVTKI